MRGYCGPARPGKHYGRLCPFAHEKGRELICGVIDSSLCPTCSRLFGDHDERGKAPEPPGRGCFGLFTSINPYCLVCDQRSSCMMASNLHRRKVKVDMEIRARMIAGGEEAISTP
ncbi:MAG: hypothetical protein ACLFS6_06530 [Methanomassiliicoccales archaeon]